MKNIVIVGSSNTDLVVQTSNFPNPGETIIGGDFNTFAGGKGANQAVAAARLGGNVSFIAKVGEDDFGSIAINGFEKDNINTEFVYKDSDAPSGVAIIMIDKNGENVIVVSPGANNNLSPLDISKAENVIASSDLILTQLETPIKTVSYVLDMAKKLGKKVILNPAPAQELGDSLYENLFLITPNESEAAILTKVEVVDERSASNAASVLLKKGVKNVIITLGSKGAFFKNNEEEFIIKANKVQVVDTTGAGDTFNGAVTVALSEGKSFKEAIAFGNVAAGISVTRLGAQSSIPKRDEL